MPHAFSYDQKLIINIIMILIKKFHTSENTSFHYRRIELKIYYT